MPEEVVKGVDCRKTYRTPKRKIRIEPRRLVIKPGQLVMLSAHLAPFECAEGCYKWTLASGKGTLSPEFGKGTNYRASEIAVNVNCQSTAAIALHIGSYYLDTAILTINTDYTTRVAYDRLTIQREIEYLPPHYTWPVPGLPPPPAGELSNHARMYTWAYQYTCRDRLINKYSWSTRDFFWSWKGAEIGWRLIYPPTSSIFMGFPQAIAYYDSLDEKRDGEIIDRRGRRALAAGCCPLKLMEKELEPPDEPLPYF